jgi:Rps23 Pro-64 3,4-dihydroxylase Tpa1-like proline 4-hydroxylase
MLIRSNFQKHLSLDKLIASFVTLGCTASVWGAFSEGNAPLEVQVRADDYPGKHLRPSLLQQLDRDGYLVVDNFLTKRQIDKALNSLKNDELFSVNPNERDGDIVRTDKVYFLKQDDSDAALNEIRKALYSVGHEISHSAFDGFTKDIERECLSYADGWLGFPTTMQISLYQKNDNVGDGGDYYRPHTDACNDGILEMGLLGFLRSKYLRKRYLTCILYLNPEWEKAHGGCLRLFVGDDQNVDIAPKAGRLVIFSSVHIIHAVLPTFSRRLACSMWMTLNEY